MSAIKSWPSSHQFTKETQYRDNLVKYLRTELNHNSFFGNDDNITKESGRGLCDIAINERECGIELKKDFKSKSALDRLVGQINRYVKEYDSVIIVLVGCTNLDTLDDLKIQIKSLGNQMFSSSITVIDKGSKKATVKKTVTQKPRAKKAPTTKKAPAKSGKKKTTSDHPFSLDFLNYYGK